MTSVKTPSKLHPSGLTQERWDWPFKTPDERKKVAAYFKKQQREDKHKQKQSINQLDRALL